MCPYESLPTIVHFANGSSCFRQVFGGHDNYLEASELTLSALRKTPAFALHARHRPRLSGPPPTTTTSSHSALVTARRQIPACDCSRNNLKLLSGSRPRRMTSLPGESTSTPEPVRRVISSTPPKKRLASCIPCRERHAKCGKERPVCSSCRSAQEYRECTYQSKRPLRFRSTFSDPRSLPQSDNAAHIVHSNDPTTSPSISSRQSHASTGSWNLEAQGPARMMRLGHSVQQLASTRLDNQQVVREASETSLVAPDTVRLHGSQWSPHLVSSHQNRWHPLSNRTESDIFAFYARSLGYWVCR